MHRHALHRKTGFTLIELLVVIAIIAILAAILFPIFTAARERGNMSKCLTHMRQIGMAVQAYIADWNDTFPMHRFQNESVIQTPRPHFRTWKDAVWPLVKSKGVFVCPSNEGYRRDGMDESGSFPISYAYNGALFNYNMALPGIRLSELDSPSKIIYILETRRLWTDVGPWCLEYAASDSYKYCPGDYRFAPGKGIIQIHMGRNANWLFADLHVQSLTVVQTCVPKSLWGIHIRGPLKASRVWSSQAWWDAMVEQKRLAPEYY